MGAASSTNTISSLVNNSIKVINDYEQSCVASPADQQINIDFNNCKQANGSVINLNNQQFISQNCILNSSTQSAISSSVSQSMRQQAQAIVQQFSFGTLADANNFINASITLADEISNTYNSNCAVKNTSSGINLICNNSTINGMVEATNFQSVTQTCVLNAVTTSSAYQNAITQLSQSAVAQQQATFAYILFGFAAILAVGAWFLVSVADSTIGQWLIVGFVLFSVIGTIIYSATAKNSGNYPYRSP